MRQKKNIKLVYIASFLIGNIEIYTYYMVSIFTECVGSYGAGCSNTCGHCYNGTTCNAMTGRCPDTGKCEPGWQGSYCQNSE